MTDNGGKAIQKCRVYIKATPQAVWDALTKPEWSVRYGYPARTPAEREDHAPRACAPSQISDRGRNSNQAWLHRAHEITGMRSPAIPGPLGSFGNQRPHLSLRGQ